MYPTRGVKRYIMYVRRYDFDERCFRRRVNVDTVLYDLVRQRFSSNRPVGELFLGQAGIKSPLLARVLGYLIPIR